MTTPPITFRMQTGALTSALEQISTLSKLVHEAAELRELSVELAHLLTDIGRIEAASLSAAGAVEVLVRAEPSERLLRLLAAMQAVKGNSGVVEGIIHREISPEVGLLESSASGESGEGVNNSLSRTNDGEDGK